MIEKNRSSVLLVFIVLLFSCLKGGLFQCVGYVVAEGVVLLVAAEDGAVGAEEYDAGDALESVDVGGDVFGVRRRQ